MDLRTINEAPEHKYSCGKTELRLDICTEKDGWRFSCLKGAKTKDNFNMAVYTTAPGFDEHGDWQRVVIKITTDGFSTNVQPVDIDGMLILFYRSPKLLTKLAFCMCTLFMATYPSGM